MNKQMKNGITEIALNEMEKIAGGSDSTDPISYTVQEGDTLFKISRRYHNITVDDLMRWNRIYNPNLLPVNTVLRIYLS